MFRKNIFFGTKVTSEAFLSISQDLKVTRLQGGTQTKLWTCWRNFDPSRSLERFLGLVHGFAVLQRMFRTKRECVALKTSFQTRLIWALWTHFPARSRFLKFTLKVSYFTQKSKLRKSSATFFFNAVRRCFRQPCTKTLSCGHPCSRKVGEDCGGCEVPVKRIVPGCGHKMEVPCGLRADQIRCTAVCKRPLRCGHVCTRQCHEKCACDVLVPLQRLAA
jgi:hypothetical protein